MTNKFTAILALASAVGPAETFAQELLPLPRTIGFFPKPYTTSLPVELKAYRTPETAIASKVAPLKANKTGQTGYLGIHVESKDNKLVVDAIQPGSPAVEAKVQIGDELIAIDRLPIRSIQEFRDRLQAHEPGERIELIVKRGSTILTLPTALAATSKPMRPDSPQPMIAARVVESDDSQGVLIDTVRQASAAERAGLKVGDVIVKFDGVPVPHPQKYVDAINARKPGDTVSLTFKRAGKEQEVKLQIEDANSSRVDGGVARRGGWDANLPRVWQKPTFRLAIIGVEYPDAKHSEKIKIEDWQKSFFSYDSYYGQNATGQKTYGSVNDYYQELSFGKFRLEGKVFNWIQMPKNRMDYGGSSAVNSKTNYLVEATNKILEREGKDALKDFDGIFFIYAGTMASDNRATLYWPHRASFNYEGKRWPYFIVNEMAAPTRMRDIGVMCHEFGHMLGMPDLYARPENPGSEGVGVWCAMSNHLSGGRPQHFSAWCKEQLDWVQPTIIDPTVKQKLVLAPIEDNAKQCYKILVRSDGSEYFLLENRQQKAFDSNLPAAGLLVWRVVNGKLFLEESHGILGPSGPQVFLGSVPFPSPSNNSFTPFTTPSSRSQLGGGHEVYITNITRQANGMISFWIGYDFE